MTLIWRDRYQGSAELEVPKDLDALLAKGCYSGNSVNMARPRSARILSVAAIIALLLAAAAPFFSMPPMSAEMSQGIATSSSPGSMHCDSCPKGDMALASCPQMNCQVAATPVEEPHFIVTETVRYMPMQTDRPAEWHTTPPVSPG